MRSNQPVPRTRRRYQVYDRSRGYQFPHQVLILLLSLIALPASAGDGYYTWVDAQGRIHNTPVSDKSSAKEDVASPADSKSVESEEFLTEEQLEEKIRKYNEENPSFYIWVDAQGVTRSQAYDAEAEQAAVDEMAEDSGAILGWDTILAVPFRVPGEVTQGACCVGFKTQFQPALKPFRSVQLFDPTRYRSFETGEGKRPAWYLEIGKVSDDNRPRFVVLRLRGAKVSTNLVAVSSEYRPLYVEYDMPSTFVPESWHGQAYQEYKILIEDAEVTGLIVFPELKPAEDMSLEIRWASGEPPF